ncbi:hypothetical protein [Croceicoccus bisphenolivorans]|uniref:hypothetical protein n=1 Tax=Croceicoccus bisphenolivorans TaxID=1783232 RepID=UPI0008373712|nr:hypothetical protein [Croceicoccus bisphenolivorans]
MRNIVMGVAAIALAAGGAYAQPGNGNGNGNGKGNGNAAASSSQGGGNGAKNADRGNGGGNGNAMRGNGNGNGNAKVAQNNGNAKSDNRGSDNRGNGNAKPMKATGNGNGNGNRADVVKVRDMSPGNSGKANGNMRDGRDVVNLFRYDSRDSRARDYGLIDGCPPGLAKKQNGCNPPGLVKRDYYGYDRSSWWGLPGLIDGRYRYYDNNLVRLSPAGAILGYYPLLGGALSAGNVWPSWYDYEPVPGYYESYYGLGPAGSYRYADNVLYRVDPDTAAITSIAALLTGDTITVGQPMPMGYSVYNVPYGYRDRYVDGPDAYYRYSDGYVYQVDPTTQLVAAAIELLL